MERALDSFANVFFRKSAHNKTDTSSAMGRAPPYRIRYFPTGRANKAAGSSTISWRIRDTIRTAYATTSPERPAYGTGDDGKSGEYKMDGNDPQGRNAHGHHMLRRAEQMEQRAGYSLKEDYPQAHDADGITDRVANGAMNTGLLYRRL